MKIPNVRIVLFGLLAIVHIGARYGAVDLLGDLTKIALMPCLAFCLELHKSNGNRMLWGAVFFSWLGDIFLIPDDDLFFLMGVGGFWIAQLCYCRLMMGRFKNPLKQALQKPTTVVPAVLLLGYLGAVLWIMAPQLEQLFWPIAAYASTLALTVFLATLLVLEQPKKQKMELLLGAVLFMISDSMIAFDAFYFAQPIFTYWIMVTYIPAQFLLVRALKNEQEDLS